MPRSFQSSSVDLFYGGSLYLYIYIYIYIESIIRFTGISFYVSIDPARRGDMEILGYCLLQWLCGTLPWEDKLTDKNYVRDSKIRFVKVTSILL